MLHERLLDRVQPSVAREALDGDDLLAGHVRRRGVAQDRTASLLTSTVQAPHRAWPHPNLVPVRPRSSRRTQSSIRVSSTVSRVALPLSVNDTSRHAALPPGQSRRARRHGAVIRPRRADVNAVYWGRLETRERDSGRGTGREPVAGRGARARGKNGRGRRGRGGGSGRAWTGACREGASPAEVLAQAGWARSVGGVTPYLTVFARAGLGRAAVDAGGGGSRDPRTPERARLHLRRAGVRTFAARAGRRRRVQRRRHGAGAHARRHRQGRWTALCDRVCPRSRKARSTPRDCSEAVGAAVKHLGEAGKKKGLTSTLPLALGRLQQAGEIRRMPDQRPPRSAALPLRPLDAEPAGAVHAVRRGGRTSNWRAGSFAWIGRRARRTSSGSRDWA